MSKPIDSELLLRYMEAVWLGGRLNVLFEQAVQERGKNRSEQSIQRANKVARITQKAWKRAKRIRIKIIRPDGRKSRKTEAK